MITGSAKEAKYVYVIYTIAQAIRIRYHYNQNQSTTTTSWQDPLRSLMVKNLLDQPGTNRELLPRHIPLTVEVFTINFGIILRRIWQ